LRFGLIDWKECFRCQRLELLIARIPIMKQFTCMCIWLSALVCTQAEEKVLFNGKDLSGWTGQPGFWSVEDGAITGRTTAEHPAIQNTFLIWEGQAADFELRFKYKLLDVDGKSVGFGNSGVQYRSKLVDASYSVISGYQADMECGKNYSGILYEEKGRGILAKRGQKVVISEGASPNKPKIEVVGETMPSDEIQSAIKPAEWNEYVIIAKGNVVQHFINGKLAVHVTDTTAVAAKSGLIALQLHQGKPMTVQFKDLVLVTD